MTARVATLPAPVGGLNLLASPTDMKANEATILDNYFPEPHRVSLRRGYDSHKTGFASAVETLIPYHGGTGTNKLFAASGTAIYDATSAGAIGAAVVSGLANARWQYVQFSAGGGDYIVLVNGVDGVRTYEGTTWATQTITVATATNFVDVTSHKSRLWFVSNNDTVAYYLSSGAIAGAAVAFDLGPVFRLGGVIAYIIPVSFNAGVGAGFDDGLAFVSTEGEVALYAGTDPANAATWAIVGVMRIGRPVRQRGYARLGGDAIVLTSDGLVSLLKTMQAERSTDKPISYNIEPALTSQVALQPTTFGWHMIVYPKGTQMLVNEPQGQSVYHQWVMNTTTNSWGRYKAMNAQCWALLGDSLYFGGAAAVFLADRNLNDNGTSIAGEIKWAFSSLGTRSAKRMTMMRPQITASGSPPVSVGYDVDFSDVSPTDVPVGVPTGAAGLWGVGYWGVMEWGGSANLVRQWALAGGLGTWIAPRIKTTTNGYEIHINAVDVMFEPAGRAVIL